MRRERILVVDDEPGMLRSLDRILRGTYEVRVSPTPTEALAVAADFRPDLALLDVRMPEMSGFELLDLLKASHPGMDAIFMTGSVTEPDSQLIRAIRAEAFYFIRKPFDRDVLLTVIERCLQLRRLADENRRHVAMLEHNLEQARIFHRSLLPPAEARLPGTFVHARCVACADLGGDIYDYARADSETAAILVADVCGHGVVAAMMTGIVKSAFHWARVKRYDPLAVIDHVAGTTRSFEKNRFVTLFAARISRQGPTLEYASAGHPPGILWSKTRPAMRLESTGPLISPAFPDFDWDKQTIRLEPGDRLLLYTDGVTDSRGPHGAFGIQRLVDEVGKLPTDGRSLIDHMLKTVHDYGSDETVQDDVTLVVADFE